MLAAGPIRAAERSQARGVVGEARLPPVGEARGLETGFGDVDADAKLRHPFRLPCLSCRPLACVSVRDQGKDGSDPTPARSFETCARRSAPAAERCGPLSGSCIPQEPPPRYQTSARARRPSGATQSRRSPSGRDRPADALTRPPCGGRTHPDFVDGRNPGPHRSARPAAGRWAGPFAIRDAWARTENWGAGAAQSSAGSVRVV